MKNILKSKILLLALFFLIPVSSFAGDDKNFGLHFGLSAILGGVSESLIHHNTDLEAKKRIIYGTAIGTFPGLVKEISDSNISETDMAGNVLGAFVGAIVANYINERLLMSINKQGDKTSVFLSFKY